MDTDLTPITRTRPPVRFDPSHTLPAPTASDRLAEWKSRGEALIRERPLAALLVAATAGMLVGRLIRLLMRRPSVTEVSLPPPRRDSRSLRRSGRAVSID